MKGFEKGGMAATFTGAARHKTISECSAEVQKCWCKVDHYSALRAVLISTASCAGPKVERAVCEKWSTMNL